MRFSVGGTGPGGVVRLPGGGGEITVEGELSSPIGLRAFELVRNGKVVPVEVEHIRCALVVTLLRIAIVERSADDNPITVNRDGRAELVAHRAV